MSNSWDHTLEQLSVHELFRLARHDLKFAAKFGDGYRTHGMCSIGRTSHQEPACYEHSYRYVTGRGGRLSWAAKLVCADHAAKVANKYGIDLARVPTQRRRHKHASEQMFDQLIGGARS
jgi:hypothetical protein